MGDQDAYFKYYPKFSTTFRTIPISLLLFYESIIIHQSLIFLSRNNLIHRFYFFLSFFSITVNHDVTHFAALPQPSQYCIEGAPDGMESGVAVAVSSHAPGDLLRVACFPAAFVWRQNWAWLSCLAIGADLAALEVAHG